MEVSQRTLGAKVEASWLRVRVQGQLTFNNSYATVDAAFAGYEIAYVPHNTVERELASGALICVLNEWSPIFEGYFL